MRLFIIGESRFGAAFFRAVSAAGHEVVAVATSSRDRGGDPLLAAALAAGVVSRPIVPILSGETGIIRASGAELLCLADVSRILPPAVIEACARGAICFHPSLLPDLRGRHAVKRALREGRAFSGVSIFWPDAGADTGPLLMQARCEIAAGDTGLTLYHDKLLPVGVHCMVAAVCAIEAGCAPRLPQTLEAAA